MSEQVFITPLNCISRNLKSHGATVPGYLKSSWNNIWFRSHTFRHAEAQYRFVYAIPAKRWSLRMIEWWAGWSVSESTGTVVRYLFDQTLQVEESELTDCLAPDRARTVGCPSEPPKAQGSERHEGPTIKRLELMEAYG